MHGLNTATRRAERLPFRIPGHRFRGFRIKASTRAATVSRSGLDARNGLSLACNAAAFTASIPGSKFPACYFASVPIVSAARYAFSSATGSAVCSATGCLNASDPLQLARPTRPAASPASTPVQDCYIPPDRSVLPDLLQFNPPSDSARSPFAPRYRSLSLVTAADQRSRFATS
jgi:hypothetical protein